MILIGEELVINVSMSSAGETNTRIETRSICLNFRDWCLWCLAASMFDGIEHGFELVFYSAVQNARVCVLLLFILVKPHSRASESLVTRWLLMRL